MNFYQPGSFIKSKAGHDRGKVYIVMSETETTVTVADGNLRKVEKPKQKNKKHIQPIHRYMNENEPWTNELVKRAIKHYVKEA